MTEERYLFDSKLSDAIEDLIKEAKGKLVLISPYIDLSSRMKSALREQLNRKAIGFELNVLFGKTGIKDLEKGKNKKLQESLAFFMEFSNVEIRFEERLHAKFYLNDYHIIFSSMNLYDYSASKNIEFGILEQYSHKGFVTKAYDVTNDAVGEVVQNVKNNLFGGSIGIDPIDKFELIYKEAELFYKTEPILNKKNDFGSKLIEKIGLNIDEIVGKNIQIDKLSPIFNSSKNRSTKSSNTETKNIDFCDTHISATKLGESKGLKYKEVITKLYQLGFIDKKASSATKLGLSKGITSKSNDKGDCWLVYPAKLQDIF